MSKRGRKPVWWDCPACGRENRLPCSVCSLCGRAGPDAGQMPLFAARGRGRGRFRRAPLPPADLAGGRAGKEDGMARAASKVDPVYRDNAYRVIRLLCERSDPRTFTSDDVWLLAADLKIPLKFPDNRALGAFISAAGRWGWCRLTGEVRATMQKASHAQPIQVWESNLRPWELGYSSPEIPDPRRKKGGGNAAAAE